MQDRPQASGASLTLNSWSRFLWAVLVTFFGAIGGIFLFVLLMNPYGNLPHMLFKQHAITDINQRFQYPALVRSGMYDSAVIGTSDARLLKPKQLEKMFGGRFANLAMNAGLAYEQYRLADLFLRKVPHPLNLIIGIDQVWCKPDVSNERVTFRGFPEWMYDDNPWNDFEFLLNPVALEISGRRLGVAVGLKEARFPAGYEVFTPPESAYDRAKVRRKLWGKGAKGIEPETPPYLADAAERGGWRFPALVWLEEIVARFPGRVILAFMPVHVSNQPVPGSERAAREGECKARIVAIAKRHSAHVVDFRIASPITTNDDNYWDQMHYRVPIADRIVTDLAAAVTSGSDAPNGDYRYLTGPNIALAPSP